MREDYSAEALRSLAKRSRDANQSRRLLSLAAVRDGMERGAAARIGGMDRQTLRDWVHRFNAAGPEGLFDHWTEGPKPRLSPEQLAEFAAIVERGPDRKVDGVVRWRRIDLNASSSRNSASTITNAMSESCSRSSAFPTSAQGPATPRKTNGSSRLSKKLPARLKRPSRRVAGDHAGRNLVSGRSAHRPEERPRAAMGQARNAATPASRPALRQRLSIRRHPARGVGAALALPYADTDMMQLHLDEISRNVAAGAHAVLLLDRAGWHTTAKLEIPANITPIFLPSRAPELNPVENVWEFLRNNWLSNLVFDTYDEIIDAACDAWRNLEADPDRITSIGMRKWAHIGHSP
jgi:transposase